MQNQEGRTLGEVVSNSVSKVTSKLSNVAGEFLYNNRKGVGLALLGTIAVAAYHGFTNPDINMLNKPAPFYVVGQDQWTQWEFTKAFYGIATPALGNYWDNLWLNLAALPAGGLVQAGLRKVSQMKV